jgi:membrane protein YdbS with pleckstrin-like domain
VIGPCARSRLPGPTLSGMPFPRQLLNQDEDIVLDVHPHWLFFAEPALTLAGLIILAIVLAVVAGNATLNIVMGILILVALVWAGWRALTWNTTHFVITSDRLIYRSGVFAKRGIQIPIERVNNVNFRQGVLERIVGAGDLLVESAGEDGQQRFTDVRHPDRIQNLIHAQLNENDNRFIPGAAPSATDAATQLEKLEGMLQRGTLTPEEFDVEKRRLLGLPGSADSTLPPPPPGAGR